MSVIEQGVLLDLDANQQPAAEFRLSTIAAALLDCIAGVGEWRQSVQALAARVGYGRTYIFAALNEMVAAGILIKKPVGSRQPSVYSVAPRTEWRPLPAGETGSMLVSRSHHATSPRRPIGSNPLAQATSSPAGLALVHPEKGDAKLSGVVTHSDDGPEPASPWVSKLQQAQLSTFLSWVREREAQVRELIQEERDHVAWLLRSLRALDRWYAARANESLVEALGDLMGDWEEGLEEEAALEFIKLLNQLGFVVTGNYYDCNLKITGGCELDEQILDFIRRYEGPLCGSAPQDTAGFTPKQLEQFNERTKVLGIYGELATHSPGAPIRFDERAEDEAEAQAS